MRIKTFSSPHTESLYNDKDVTGLKLKLQNEKTRVLSALLEGMEAKHSKAGPAPAPVLALASLYKEARQKNAALPHISDVWLAAEAFLGVHQEARVDAMVAPDAKKPAKNRGRVMFAQADAVQKFDKEAAPKALKTLAPPKFKPAKAHAALRQPIVDAPTVRYDQLAVPTAAFALLRSK